MSESGLKPALLFGAHVGAGGASGCCSGFGNVSIGCGREIVKGRFRCAIVFNSRPGSCGHYHPSCWWKINCRRRENTGPAPRSSAARPTDEARRRCMGSGMNWVASRDIRKEITLAEYLRAALPWVLIVGVSQKQVSVLLCQRSGARCALILKLHEVVGT